MKYIPVILKTLWKQSLGLLVASLLCGFAIWGISGKASPLPMLAVSAGVWLVVILILYGYVASKMKYEEPFFRIMRECGPCEEALKMHRHLYPNPSPPYRIARADLLIAMDRFSEAEAELLSIPQPLQTTAPMRLRYHNCRMCIYAYTLRRQDAWQYYQACCADADTAALRLPDYASSYYNTASLVLAMAGDAYSSERYCQRLEQFAQKKKDPEKVLRIMIHAAVTRTERLYALGDIANAAALEAQARTAIENFTGFEHNWQKGFMLHLLDRAKTYVYSPAQNPNMISQYPNSQYPNTGV